MSDSYVLKNVGAGIVSFKVMAHGIDTRYMPKHKRRKVLRSAATDIHIPRGGTVDLVKKLDLPSVVIAEIPEVKQICSSPNVRLLSVLIEDTSKATERAEAKADADAETEEAAATAVFEAQQKAQQDSLDAEAKEAADKEAADKEAADKEAADKEAADKEAKAKAKAAKTKAAKTKATKAANKAAKAGNN